MLITALKVRNAVEQTEIQNPADAKQITAAAQDAKLYPKGFNVPLPKSNRDAVRALVGDGFTVTARIGGGLAVKRNG